MLSVNPRPDPKLSIPYDSLPVAWGGVHLVVYAVQSKHGQFFSSRCARRDAEMHSLTVQVVGPTCCIAAAMFLR